MLEAILILFAFAAVVAMGILMLWVIYLMLTTPHKGIPVVVVEKKKDE